MKDRNYFDFEDKIADLETKIEVLRDAQSVSAADLSEQIITLSEQRNKIIESLYSTLTPWQIVQVARHSKRPYTLDYINSIFSDFIELHGDRHLADDKSIVGGLARLDDNPCVVIGHQKGRTVAERIERNFGYTRPEGYRKALRLLKMAEKFNLPVFTFLDTPGAWPGIDAEQHSQSEAIARNLIEMSGLKTPIIATVIGEGGSGGALAIGVCDTLIMLQYSIYSVIAPESCSSILWRNTENASKAADALCLTAERLKALGLVDMVINEPVGGAHRNPDEMAVTLKHTLLENLKALEALDKDQLVERRQERLLNFGEFKEGSP